MILLRRSRSCPWIAGTAGVGLIFNNIQPISVGAGALGSPGGSVLCWRRCGGWKLGGHFKEFWCSRDAVAFLPGELGGGASLVPGWRQLGMGPTSIELLVEIELKSLILAQIERWRHALHMQVERQRGGNSGGERRTGE